MQFSTYKIINLVLFILLLICILWLVSIKMDITKPPQCQYKSVTDKDCPSCGMTRDFVSILENSNEMILINKISIYYFIFFISAIISRSIALIASMFNKINEKYIIFDILFSFLLFISLIIIPYFK